MHRVGYERLSKDRSLKGTNVEIQRQEIKEFALGNGKPIWRHYSDNHKSASEFGTKPREKYLELVEDIKKSLVSEIIVTEIPRLCRQSTEANELIQLSKVTAFRFVKTTDDGVYDLHTPRGRKDFREAVSDAEFETDQGSTRQRRKKNHQAERGKYHGGQRAFGYQGPIRDVEGMLLNYGKIGRAFIDEEVAVIRECVKRIIGGEGITNLARELNKRGVATASGAKWRAGNLSMMLTNKRRVQWKDTEHGTRNHKGVE
jgi:site-specific DNA recombinase